MFGGCWHAKSHNQTNISRWLKSLLLVYSMKDANVSKVVLCSYGLAVAIYNNDCQTFIENVRLVE